MSTVLRDARVEQARCKDCGADLSVKVLLDQTTPSKQTSSGLVWCSSHSCRFNSQQHEMPKGKPSYPRGT